MTKPLDTNSLLGIFRLMRDRIMNFTPQGGGGTIGSLLPGGFQYIQAADGLKTAHAVGRLGFRRENNGLRLEGTLEVQIYARPRSKQEDVEHIADLMQEALLQWADARSGVVFSGGDVRDSLPIFPDPADREVAGVRIVFDVVCWPYYLGKYVES